MRDIIIIDRFLYEQKTREALAILANILLPGPPPAGCFELSKTEREELDSYKNTVRIAMDGDQRGPWTDEALLGTVDGLLYAIGSIKRAHKREQHRMLRVAEVTFTPFGRHRP